MQKCLCFVVIFLVHRLIHFTRFPDYKCYKGSTYPSNFYLHINTIHMKIYSRFWLYITNHRSLDQHIRTIHMREHFLDVLVCSGLTSFNFQVPNLTNTTPASGDDTFKLNMLEFTSWMAWLKLDLWHFQKCSVKYLCGICRKVDFIFWFNLCYSGIWQWHICTIHVIVHLKIG